MKTIEEIKTTIRKRNIREWMACALVFPVFLYFSLDTASLVSRFFFIEICLASLFVAFYIYRNSHLRLVTDDREELLKNEIQFLKTVPFWYCLPLGLGLIGDTSYNLYINLTSGTSYTISLACLILFILISVVATVVNLKAAGKLEQELG